MVLAALACAFLFQEGNPAAGSGSAPPRPRGWDDFPVFVWRERYAGKPLPEELAEPFGGVILMREEDSGWARERGLSYLVWNVAGRDALHLDADEAWNERVEKWIETRDEALLVREPCLNDPETVTELFATLDKTIAKHGEHPGLGFVLGDEVGLTPNGDPFDLCRCGLCEARWREHAKETGLPERAPLTDEVRLRLLEDDFSMLGAWLERRRFDQGLFLTLLQRLADRASDGDRPVALLGLKEPTAFGGVDLGAVSRFIDVLEGYPVGDTRAQLDALRPPTRSPSIQPFDSTVSTVFLDGESPQGAAWLVWEAWMSGANGLVLWSDAVLAAAPECRNRLAVAAETVRRVETLHGSRVRSSTAPLGLISDADSVAVGWLRDALLDGPTWPRRRAGYQVEHGTRERALETCLHACADLGPPPLAFPLATIESHSPAVLLLVETLVLDEADVKRLESQLDRGGSLVIVGTIGWVDRRGRPWSASVLERLRAHAPERVFHVGNDVVTRDGLKDLLVRAGAPTTKLRIASDSSSVLWLVRSTLASAFDCGFELAGAGPPPQFCVALPLAETSAARAELKPIELLRDARVEWIHPPGGGLLPAGDAAVFLLRSGTDVPR